MVKKTQNTYNSTATAKYIAIIAHIRNSTPEELAVIAKYTTDYETTSASWNSKHATSTAEVAEEPNLNLQGTPINVAMKEVETKKRDSLKKLEASSSTKSNHKITKQNQWDTKKQYI